jgi:hypothetical protein
MPSVKYPVVSARPYLVCCNEGQIEDEEKECIVDLLSQDGPPIVLLMMDEITITASNARKRDIITRYERGCMWCITVTNNVPATSPEIVGQSNSPQRD